MILDFTICSATRRRPATASPRRLARAAGFAALALAAACSPSTAKVTQGTASGTGCSQQDLVVFNYDRKSRNWLAACQGRVFVCSPGKAAASKCAAQQDVDPSLVERIEALAQVPAPQRELFVNYDVSAQDWDAFAMTVGTVARLRPEQAQQIDDPRRVYSAFSPEFDTALTQCVGPDGVAKVDVSSSGGLTVSPNKACLMSLRGTADLGALRAYPGQSYYLAAGVRGVEPVARPGSEEPEEPAEPEVTPLEIAVRGWLDAAAADILACTNTGTTVVQVHVGEDGNAAVALREDLAGSAAEGCVRSALGERTFEGDATELVHLVRAPEPAPEDAGEGEGEAEAEAPDTAPKQPAAPKPADL